jgi:23S rRNA (uracil1939-C5)-methyltransferase
VIGVECVPDAILDAEDNAKRNQIKNTVFHCAQAENFIGTLSAIDVAVLNPPRKGCEPAFLEKLLQLKPKRIVYVSCDPATLARDLAILQKEYTVNTVQPFDMFPQTVHVESIAHIQLKDDGL